MVGKQIRFQESPGGWVSAEIEDGFVFGAGTPTKNRNGYMRKVINQIIGGTETIEVAVTDGKNPSKVVVSVIFPVANGRESFKSLLKALNEPYHPNPPRNSDPGASVWAG